jgi:hypothetical protein
MGITIIKKPSRGKGEQKVFYTLSWGRGPGEREATGIYTFAKPKNQTQRNHNLQALAVLEKKHSQMVLDKQSISVGSVPPHRFKLNFLEYYSEFVDNNKQFNNRHIEGSFSKYYGLGAAGLLEAEVVTADGRVLHANACQHPDLFWALKGGGGGTFGIVTKLTLRTRELPETFGVVYGEIQASNDMAYRILIRKLIDQYAENLFNENWGEQMIFNPSRKVNITMLFHGLSQDVAQNAWSSFKQWVVDKPGDYRFITPLTVLVLPARLFWNATFLEEHAPGLIALDNRPGSGHEKFFYANNRGECGQFLHGYDSAWLPKQLLEKAERPRLTDTLYASSMIWTTGIHFNKGLAGSRPEEIAAARDCAMNPAVTDAFALAIIAGGGEPAYAGVSGHEPDVKEASSAALKIRQAMTTLRAGIQTTGSYLNESDYFNDNWRQSYWGENYNRLAAVKKQYDPEGLFFVHHGVGSEYWSKDGFERIS